MRNLILLVILLLLMPFGFDGSLRADETDPPPDPGGDPGDLGDDGEDGDHPWGGEEKSYFYDDIKPHTDQVAPTTLESFFRFWLPAYYGIRFDRLYQTNYSQKLISSGRPASFGQRPDRGSRSSASRRKR